MDKLHLPVTHVQVTSAAPLRSFDILAPYKLAYYYYCGCVLTCDEACAIFQAENLARRTAASDVMCSSVWNNVHTTVRCCQLSQEKVYHYQETSLNHTLARQCESVLKATKQVNGKGQNSTPRHTKTPQPIFTKIGRHDYVQEGTRHAKFCSDRSRGFCSPNT